MGATQAKPLQNTKETYDEVFKEAYDQYTTLHNQRTNGISIFDIINDFVETKQYPILYVILYEHLQSDHILYFMKDIYNKDVTTHMRYGPRQSEYTFKTGMADIYRLKTWATIYKSFLDNFDIIQKQLDYYHKIVIAPLRKGGSRKKGRNAKTSYKTKK